MIELMSVSVKGNGVGFRVYKIFAWLPKYPSNKIRLLDRSDLLFTIRNL